VKRKIVQKSGKADAEELLILETYPKHESAYDGLTGLFNEVKTIGTVVPDTKDIAAKKVLVCGIAHLYEQKISPRNKNVLFTTFESDHLPADWVQSINRYRHCIVSHPEIKKVFIASGVTVPVSVVHNGYRRYKKRKQPRTNEKQFSIGFLGIPVNRKNLVKLYAACRELKESLIPGLKLHVHAASFYDWLDPAPFEEMKKDPMVSWTTGKYTTEQIADWYHQLSCYIFPSSGEGWSYTPRESMHLGIPTIISDIPAHTELAQSGFYNVIASSCKEPADFNGVTHGRWDCIEKENIKDAIADTYRRYDHYQDLAGRGAAWVKHRWKNGDISYRIRKLLATV